MYYVYTIESVNKVYVGSTGDPLSRMYAHSSKGNTTSSKVIVDGVFYLRYQYTTAKEAITKEQELMDTLPNVVNNNRAGAGGLMNPKGRSITLSAKLKGSSTYKHTYRVTNWGGKRFGVMYNRHWKMFTNKADAISFANELNSA